MPWSDDGVPVPERSEAELLPVVGAKARAIRRRRLQIVTGVVAGLVVVVGCLVVAGRQSGDHPTRITMASPATSSAPGEGGIAFSPTEPLAEPPATTTSATSIPAAAASSAEAWTPPAIPPAPTPIPADLPPAASQNPPAPPPDPAPAPPRCDPSEIVVTSATDRPSYVRGDTIVLTLTAVNVSDRGCWPPAGYLIEIFDAARHGYGMAGHVDYSAPPPALPPGASVSETIPLRTCSPGCAEFPPGTYTIAASMDGYGAPSISVQVTS